MRKFLIVTAIALLLLLAGCKGGEEAPTEEQPTETAAEETPPTAIPNVSETPTEVPEAAENETPEEALEEENQTEEQLEQINETNETLVEEVTEEQPPAEEEQAEGVAITVLSEETEWLDPANPENVIKTEETSLFTNVQCAIGTSAEESGYTGNTQSDDLLTFTLNNQDAHEYYLAIEKPEDSPTSDSMKLMINGRRIRTAEEKCGSNYIKANEAFTCQNVLTVLKSGMSARGQELNNKLEANTRYYRTELIFKC
ncbi:hypothetical protein HY488_03410 [Candidatus Woesearchaeota archaeon]|nr:hypothetical protein [Candidatus Woesearchaeota archaeon]